MNLGIITYIAENKSHGYLFQLNNLDEKSVYETIRQKDRTKSCYIRLDGQALGLRKFQIVNYSVEIDEKGREYAKIDSAYLRAVAKSVGNFFRIIIVELDESIPVIESADKSFGNSETGIVMFQLSFSYGGSSSNFIYDDIITIFDEETNIRFWQDKFLNFCTIYLYKLVLLFSTFL